MNEDITGGTSDAIGESRIVLSVAAFGEVIGKPVELPFDENCFNKRSDDGAIGFGLVEIIALGWAVDHGTTGLVRSLPRLNIVPVFYGPAVFKPKDLKTDFAAREIVLGVGEDKVTILECPHDIYPRRGLGKAFEERR